MFYNKWKKSVLAINGGRPLINKILKPVHSIGNTEIEAVKKVLKSGCLSGFYGSWGKEFLGGPEVRKFENEWSERFGVEHVISVNSATSGLYAAIAAIGVSPGDEIIVPSMTMSATAVCPILYGGIPIFVDIEQDTFCLDIEKVRNAITDKTKAIIAVNLFGHPARLKDLAQLAKEKNIYLIEDNAQAPLSSEYSEYSGTIGDIGVFSLNYHKHIHTGEGGMCVTKDTQLALRMQAVRNHAENIIGKAVIESQVNMIGMNYRMTEMTAAVGRVQLKKIETEVAKRKRIGEALSEELSNLEGVIVPKVRDGCEHVYYVWAAKIDEQVLGIQRKNFSAALAAEGFPHFEGYVEPLYMLPVFQKRLAIGSKGWPFCLTSTKYEKGMCQVAEKLHNNEIIGFETCAYELGTKDIKELINAFKKVHSLRANLK